MPTAHAKRLTISALSAALVLGSAATAMAGGFAAARFGGERGNPTEANPFSLYYNPGGLGMTTGTRLTIDSSFVFRDATYERPAPAGTDLTTPDAQANFGEGSVSNFLIAPAFAVSSDFGIEGSPFVVGLGFFVPFGGSAVWDTADPVEGAAGAVDGPQRWYTIDGTIQSLAFSGGVGFNIEPARLSLGLSSTLYISKVDTIRARNSDGGDAVNIEGRSWANVENTSIGVGAGVLWEAVEDQLWIGASYQSQPGFGELEYEGTLTNLLAASAQSETDIIFTQSLPDIIRLGGRFKAADNLELRLFADYTRWSVFENQCLLNVADKGNKEDVCGTNADGTQANAAANDALQVLQRQWEDTIGVRLGASFWLMPEFEILAGAGYDGNAVPDKSLEPALIDTDKVTASLGIRYDFTQFLALTLTGTNVFYLERDTTGIDTADAFQNPSRQPSSAGVYNQNIFLLNANLDMAF